MNLTTDQEQARELLVRLRGMSSGNAATYVLNLEDAETAAIAAAAPLNHTDADRARREIKLLVAKFDERRGADQGQAGLPIAAAIGARNGARELLQLHYGLPADDAALHESRLTTEQREALGRLAGDRVTAMANFQCDPVSTDQVRAIVGAELVPSLHPTADA